jgi:hypothetical protein
MYQYYPQILLISSSCCPTRLTSVISCSTSTKKQIGKKSRTYNKNYKKLPSWPRPSNRRPTWAIWATWREDKSWKDAPTVKTLSTASVRRSQFPRVRANTTWIQAPRYSCADWKVHWVTTANYSALTRDGEVSSQQQRLTTLVSEFYWQALYLEYYNVIWKGVWK